MASLFPPDEEAVIQAAVRAAQSARAHKNLEESFNLQPRRKSYHFQQQSSIQGATPATHPRTHIFAHPEQSSHGLQSTAFNLGMYVLLITDMAFAERFSSARAGTRTGP